MTKDFKIRPRMTLLGGVRKDLTGRKPAAER
jgi:hypothetical protein